MSCPCLKPSITVEGHNNDIIGRLELKYYGPFCGLNRCSITEIQVYDKLQRFIYTISCNCCQKPVVWLPCQCESCKNIEYKILDEKLEQKGSILATKNGYCRELCTRDDVYLITFPENIVLSRKLLLVQAAIWLDYLHYRA